MVGVWLVRACMSRDWFCVGRLVCGEAGRMYRIGLRDCKVYMRLQVIYTLCVLCFFWKDLLLHGSKGAPRDGGYVKLVLRSSGGV